MAHEQRWEINDHFSRKLLFWRIIQLGLLLVLAQLAFFVLNTALETCLDPGKETIDHVLYAEVCLGFYLLGLIGFLYIGRERKLLMTMDVRFMDCGGRRVDCSSNKVWQQVRELLNEKGISYQTEQRRSRRDLKPLLPFVSHRYLFLKPLTGTPSPYNDSHPVLRRFFLFVDSVELFLMKRFPPAVVPSEALFLTEEKIGIAILKHPFWRTNWLILGKIHKDSEAPTNWPLLARLEREIKKLPDASKSSAVAGTISPKKKNQSQ